MDSQITLSADFLESALDMVQSGIIILNDQKRVVVWNSWIEKHSGLSPELALGLTLEDVFPSDRLSRIYLAVDSAIDHSQSSVISNSINPSPFSLYATANDRLNKTPISQAIIVKSSELENENYCFIQISDVSPSVRRERVLRERSKDLKILSDSLFQEKEFAQITLESIGEAVFTTDKKTKINFANAAAAQLLGLPKEDIIGKLLLDVIQFVSHEHRQYAQNVVDSILKDGAFGALAENATLFKESGDIGVDTQASPLRNEYGGIIGIVTIVEDVSQERSMRDLLSFQATHDELTGLINRREFTYRLEGLLHRAKTDKQDSVLLYLDLDQFKIVNDTCGHPAGDALLKQLSHELMAKLRNTDTLARLGGDEFGILLTGCSEEVGEKIAEGIRELIQDFRFSWDNRAFGIGVSIGLVLITDVWDKTDSILGAADSCCYMAKEQGRNKVIVHKTDSAILTAQKGEMLWASRISEALENNYFEIHCQPIVPILDDEDDSISCEILIRLRDENGQIVPPMAFIPAAERYDVMTKIDRWVVTATTEFWAKNTEVFNQLDKCAINLSGQSLNDRSFLDFVIEQIEKTGCPWEKICFEITETAAVANLDLAHHFIATMKDKGVRFSLDDFGSGLSSFAYLKQLNVDYLKIDGAFVKHILEDPVDNAMVKSISDVGHILNLGIIAEFVEDKNVIGRLRSHNVHYAQGWGISKPFPVEELGKFQETYKKKKRLNDFDRRDKVDSDRRDKVDSDRRDAISDRRDS